MPAREGITSCPCKKCSSPPGPPALAAKLPWHSTRPAHACTWWISTRRLNALRADSLAISTEVWNWRISTPLSADPAGDRRSRRARLLRQQRRYRRTHRTGGERRPVGGPSDAAIWCATFNVTRLAIPHLKSSPRAASSTCPRPPAASGILSAAPTPPASGESSASRKRCRWSWAVHGIRANAILPGPVAGPRMARVLGGARRRQGPDH